LTDDKSPNSDLGIKLRFKKHRLDFDDAEKSKYAIIGYYVTEMARLEFELDRFMFHINKNFPKISKRISNFKPMKISEISSFVVYSFVMIPKLREIGDLDQGLSLNRIYYGLQQLFNERNHIIHGKATLTEDNNGHISFQSKKYTKENRKNYSVIEVKYTSSYLESALYQINYFVTLLSNSLDNLTEERNPKRERDKLLRGHAYMRQHFETGSSRGDFV